MRIYIAIVSSLLGSSLASAAINTGDVATDLVSRALKDGIYELSREANVKPISSEILGEVTTNVEQTEVTIPPRLPFAIKIEGATAVVTPMIANEAMGSTPDLFVLNLIDLERLQPRFLAPGDATAMYETFSQDAISLVAGRCKYYVQRHLGFYVPGMCASTMTSAKLARVGFRPVSCERAQLKVWGGGRRGCGHVAYRTRSGQWSSTDYVGDPGSNYYTKGCYSR